MVWHWYWHKVEDDLGDGVYLVVLILVWLGSNVLLFRCNKCLSDNTNKDRIFFKFIHGGKENKCHESTKEFHVYSKPRKANPNNTIPPQFVSFITFLLYLSFTWYLSKSRNNVLNKYQSRSGLNRIFVPLELVVQHLELRVS